MANIYDTVFGELEEKRGWQKKEEVNFWNKNILLRIKVTQYANKEITGIQRENYKQFKKNVYNISIKVKEAIEKYISDNKENIQQSFSSDVSLIPENLVTPTTIIFFADGQFGILFECEWDREHGLSVSLKDYSVGPQDMLL